MVAKDFQGMAILPRPPAKMGVFFTKAHHRHTAHGHHGDGHPFWRMDASGCRAKIQVSSLKLTAKAP